MHAGAAGQRLGTTCPTGVAEAQHQVSARPLHKAYADYVPCCSAVYAVTPTGLSHGACSFTYYLHFMNDLSHCF